MSGLCVWVAYKMKRRDMDACDTSGRLAAQPSERAPKARIDKAAALCRREMVFLTRQKDNPPPSHPPFGLTERVLRPWRTCRGRDWTQVLEAISPRG